ncbi:metalloregulator ArsR/SmtB family transcription factor [Kocuria rhizophila]|uniref:ArsR/SmtB family transcription factor n=1 Tax=Kocuria rhizophila TaxID=72000 RepID=UPI001C70349E|nr:metalloregulator ArsR/SmtB family transcription factor [Kocuria rhizophila]
MSHDAYSALSDPTRRRILAALQDGARPVGELVTELEVSQPTVSKHLKVLRDARMVSTRAQGQKRFYSIAPEPLEEVVAWLGELVAAGADPVGGTTPPAPASEPVPPVASDEAAPEGGDTTEPEGDAGAARTEEPTSAEAAAADEPAGAVEASAVEGPSPVVHEPAPSAEDAEEEDRSPAAESAPERSVPWFTADVTEVTEDEESGTGVVPAAVDDAPGAGEAGHESGAPVVSDVEDEAAELRTGYGETDPAADRESEDLATTAEHSAETLPDEEAPVTAASLENDVPADARAQSDAVREAGPRDPAGPDPSESAELLRPRGGAHRRQSGLLSTLTGFRRRGRGTRRD